MPWCDTFSQYFAPSALNPDGTCPTCGRQVGDPATQQPEADPADEKTPWHFKLLVVALIVYLGWRFVELFGFL